MYVYVCAEENNFLRCCSIIYFVSGDGSIYVRLFLVVHWFFCYTMKSVLKKFLYVNEILQVTIKIALLIVYFTLLRKVMSLNMVHNWSQNMSLNETM